MVFLFTLVPPRGGGQRERRGGHPVPGAAPQGGHSLEGVRHLPDLSRPTAAPAATSLPAGQALADGGHRLLASPLDFPRHHCQDRGCRAQLHSGPGEAGWMGQRSPGVTLKLNLCQTVLRVNARDWQVIGSNSFAGNHRVLDQGPSCYRNTWCRLTLNSDPRNMLSLIFTVLCKWLWQSKKNFKAIYLGSKLISD